MAKYLLIESRDPFESNDTEAFAAMIEGIAARGHETVLFLVQNGVLAARHGAKFNDRLSALAQKKIKILADEFSLRERGIRELSSGVQAASLKELIKYSMEDGAKTIWH